MSDPEVYALELDGQPNKATVCDWTPLCVHEINGVPYTGWMPRADQVRAHVLVGKTVKICNLTMLGIKDRHEDGEVVTTMTITPTTGMPIVPQE